MTMLFSIKLDKTKKMLTIRLPLERPRPSASGKTLVLASTHGCKTGEAVLCGRPIAVTANAFIFQEKRLKLSDRDSRKRPKAGRKGESFQRTTGEEQTAVAEPNSEGRKPSRIGSPMKRPFKEEL
jgi:hypothetical protein